MTRTVWINFSLIYLNEINYLDFLLRGSEADFAFLFNICSFLSTETDEVDAGDAEADEDEESPDLLDVEEPNDLLIAAKPARPTGLLLGVVVLDAAVEPEADDVPVELVDVTFEDEEALELTEFEVLLEQSRFARLNGTGENVDDPLPPLDDVLPETDDALDCSNCCFALTKCIADSLPILIAA